MQTNTYIIIGTSAAGLSAATTLVKQAEHARIIAISDEAEPPYNKCLLVDYLSGDQQREQLLTLRANPQFTVLLGRSVTAIDPAARRVTLDDGTHLLYDKLFMSMGARAHMPALPRYAGIFAFYSLADVDTIIHYSEQRSVRRAVVVGSGLNGLECANALIKRGITVTVIERSNRVLSHHTDAGGSAFIHTAARNAGVTIHTNVQVTEITGAAGCVTGVVLSDGTHIDTELVIVAIGSRPNSALARQAGIAMSADHVRVDARLQTSEDHIFAGGDLVVAPCAVTGMLVPSTTWPDAVLQGTIAAYTMLGSERTYPGVVGHTVSHLFGFDIAACGRLCDSSQRDVVIVERPGAYRVFELVDGRLQAYSLIGDTASATMVCRRALLTQQPIASDELRAL